MGDEANWAEVLGDKLGTLMASGMVGGIPGMGLAFATGQVVFSGLLVGTLTAYFVDSVVVSLRAQREIVRLHMRSSGCTTPSSNGSGLSLAARR